MPVTYSPLRYPGGKTQLANFVGNLINLNDVHNCTYIEPFAGGSGVSLQLLFENRVNHVVINDYDKSIYSFWNSILKHTDEFIEKIDQTPVTIEEWHNQRKIYQKNRNRMNSVEGGFATFFLNRTNVSGIINGGPIGGKAQKSKYTIDCRFNKQTAIRKILNIADRKDDITLYRKDANKLVEIIKNEYRVDNTFIFFDPPYFVQGKNLYLSFIDHKDHIRMRDSINTLDDYFWILTYDTAPQIAEIYSETENKFEYELNYSANTKKKATEFLFCSPITQVESFDKVHLLEF